ncbi:MAG: DUF4160 domain-containing protein [Treponema sp.]|nr:DUF4160 domain-containing protein [uncultured Treponema sp.]MDY5886571.1 DUF4160 domain-containing protein [Treponema sp.]
MPEIARFYGIIIKMFFKPKEHEPSHIHANVEKLQIMWDTQNIYKLNPLE